MTAMARAVSEGCSAAAEPAAAALALPVAVMAGRGVGSADTCCCPRVDAPEHASIGNSAAKAALAQLLDRDVPTM